MNSTKIITFDFLIECKRIHVKITDSFFCKIKDKIINAYGNSSNFNKILNINYRTLVWEFRNNAFHPFYRILKIVEILNISKEELYSNIIGFYHWGSHDNNYLQIPKILEIDEFFVEGFSLYLAEGDTGFNGTTKPDGFRFTNSNHNVINHMIKWINTYFPNIKFYVSVIKPKLYQINYEKIKELINHNKINLKEDYYNKIVKYRIILDRAIIIYLILAIETKIKELCGKDKKLAAAYIRGMMIGEGTAYFNRSRYVRIEMKNEKEIKYLHSLFKILGYTCEPSLRTTRHNMWSLYIGAKQLNKFAKEVGFGIHEKRQKILEEGANKILRVNQYC